MPSERCPQKSGDLLVKNTSRNSCFTPSKHRRMRAVSNYSFNIGNKGLTAVLQQTNNKKRELMKLIITNQKTIDQLKQLQTAMNSETLVHIVNVAVNKLYQINLASLEPSVTALADANELTTL
jgi:hypothetical protein